MKFYEVQKALEEGKKVKLPDMGGHLVYLDHCSHKIHYILNGHVDQYHINETELLSNDWEIIEDRPTDSDIKLNAEIVELYPGIKVLKILKPLPINEKTVKLRDLIENGMIYIDSTGTRELINSLKEDIPEAKIETTISETFTCPSCKTSDEYWPSKKEDFEKLGYFKCGRCGQKIRPTEVKQEAPSKLQKHKKWLEIQISEYDKTMDDRQCHRDIDLLHLFSNKKTALQDCLLNISDIENGFE